jgi:serine protease SohB
LTEALIAYALFLAETFTLLVLIGGLLVVVIRALRETPAARPEHLEITDLNDRYRETARALKHATLPAKVLRKAVRAETKEDKARDKAGEGPRRRLYVIDFHGDIRASGVAALRECITAVLLGAVPGDEVLVRLENAGGLVAEHGLAASQLARIRARQIRLTVAVDKVAASGGYLMACVADRILAAPFAILGSIGVVAQLPNFHRVLERHGVDF